MMNVITGSSHYNQLSVVTSYRGISDYHSNKMVITTCKRHEGIVRRLEFSTNTISLQETQCWAHVPRGHGC